MWEVFTLNAVVMEGPDGGAGAVLVQDTVGVGGYPLLGRRVELISARVILGNRATSRLFNLRQNLTKKIRKFVVFFTFV